MFRHSQEEPRWNADRRACSAEHAAAPRKVRTVAAERARLQLHYCNLFKFWRECGDRRCRRHLRCCGNASECLKHRIGEIPRHAQFQARQAILVTTPKNAGGAERTVRQFMPYDVITPDPLQVAAQFEARRR
jgi:hypothetical protein